VNLITGMGDDLLRVAANVRGGHATAALVVGKLCSSKRQQNALTSAIKEYGALRRTVYAARYLADETYRRRIARQLNKGENLPALRRSLAYAGEGALRRRHHEQQTEQVGASPGHQRDRLLVHRVPRPRRGSPAPDRHRGRAPHLK
jgi:TnpA family transposase